MLRAGAERLEASAAESRGARTGRGSALGDAALAAARWESRIASLNSSREAESLAEELGDKRRLAHVSADSSAYFSQEGDHQRAINSGERALALATEMGDSALQINAQVRLVRVYYQVGRLSSGH